MSLKVAIAVLFLFTVKAQAEHVCIGKGNTPSSNPFYADKIQSLVDESHQLEVDIKSNEDRLVAIDKELESLRNRIPNLFKELQSHPDVKTHPTLKLNFAELQSYYQKHELQYADKLIADKKSEVKYKVEEERIQQLRIDAHAAFKKNQNRIEETIRSATRSFEKEFLDIDERTRRVEEYYREQREKLAEGWRQRLSPPLLGKAPSKESLEAMKKRIEEGEKAQLLPMRQKRSEFTQNFNKTVQQFREQISQENASFVDVMKGLEEKSSANRQAYEQDLQKNQGVYDGQVDTDNAVFDSKVQSMKSRLLNDSNPRIQAFAKSDKIISGVTTAKKNIQNLTAERKNIPAEIERLKRKREEYKFISLWWKEQGHLTKSTEAQACLDCEKTPKQNDLFKVPHLKLSCIESSIQNKQAYNTEIMCDDSGRNKGTTQNLCVTKEMANYTQWALNNALNCLSSPSDPIDPQGLYRKLNNESIFKNFYAYEGGQGIMQTIGFAQNEILGLANNGRSSIRSEGRKHLASIMNKNKANCAEYSSIIDFEKEARIDELTRTKSNPKELNRLKAQYPQHNQRLFNQGLSNSCQFISLQDGIHRNIINGLGLNIYYRKIAQDDLTNQFLRGTNITKNPQFKKIRDALTMVYYGPSGPYGGKNLVEARVIPEVKARFRDLSKMPAEEFEKILAKHVGYIKAIQRSEGAVNSGAREDELKCVQK